MLRHFIFLKEILWQSNTDSAILCLFFSHYIKILSCITLMNMSSLSKSWKLFPNVHYNKLSANVTSLCFRPQLAFSQEIEYRSNTWIYSEFSMFIIKIFHWNENNLNIPAHHPFINELSNHKKISDWKKMEKVRQIPWQKKKKREREKTICMCMWTACAKKQKTSICHLSRLQ